MSQHLNTGLTIALMIAVVFLTSKVYLNDANTEVNTISHHPTHPVTHNQNTENSKDSRQLELLNLTKAIKELELKIVASSQNAPIRTDPTNDTQLQNQIKSLQAQVALLGKILEKNNASTEVISHVPNTNNNTSHEPPPQTIKENNINEQVVAPTISSEQLAHMERRGSGALDVIEPKVTAYLREKSYSKAYFQLGNFPTKLLDTEAGKQKQVLEQRVEDELKKDYAEQIKFCKGYLDKNQYPLAIEYLMGLKDRYQCHSETFEDINKHIEILNDEYQTILTRPVTNITPDKKKIDDKKKQSKKNFKTIINKLGSDDYNESKTARMLLQKAGKDALDDLISESENNNEIIRRFCITLLSQLDIDGDKKIEQLFILSLRDREPAVCFAALSALQKIASYRSIDEIISLVNKNNIDNKIAKKSISVFNEILDIKVPGSDFLEINNVEEIQSTMKKIWAKKKPKFIDETN